MGFSDSVKMSADKMKAGVNSQIVGIAKELFTAIVIATPVNAAPEAKKRGELKNNWYAGEGIGNYNKSYSTSFDTEGGNSLTQASSVSNSTAFVDKDSELSFTNTVPYGYLAEVTGWPQPKWTGQVGPYAMVRNSMVEVISKIK